MIPSVVREEVEARIEFFQRRSTTSLPRFVQSIPRNSPNTKQLFQLPSDTLQLVLNCLKAKDISRGLDNVRE